MKNRTRLAVLHGAILVLLVGVMLLCAACGSGQQIVIEGDFQDGAVIEYTGQKIQFPLGYVADSAGTIQSYAVQYQVINLADNSTLTDEYATFTLKTGDYQLVYTYTENPKVSKKIDFSIKDTISPTIEFIDVPNGLFLQDITEDTVNKLPLYTIEDASTGDGIDLTRVLRFKGEADADFREYKYREINNSYEVETFGIFQYELTATDVYGNQTVATVQWKVKDRDWRPSQLPGDGILADYSVEGYCNLVEGGDANQYYKIGNDYTDEWLPEFEGAQGVLKLELPFNNAAGFGNNTIRLRLPKTFTQRDLAGKYLAVRIYVEGEHLRENFLFAGNNVEFRPEDSTTRAFSTSVSGLKTGVWKTYYIEAATAQNIGIYPNGKYNSNTTFYEGGDPADAIQLCFHREGGYFNDMTLYVDSVSIAEILPDTQISISGNKASWTDVAGASGYRVNLNGEETVVDSTEMELTGTKGYIRVTPMGNGVTTLDAQTVTAVYGLDAGGKLAAFDDELYIDLFTQQLQFSTDAEHYGYKPKSLTASLTENGLTVDIGTGEWGVVTGIRLQFPKAQAKGSNTTLILNMNVSNADYGQIRVYDYSGKLLGNIKLDASNTGKLYAHEIDLSAYKGNLEGIQLIFGPNSSFSTVSGGVSVTFKDIYLDNTYYPIVVNGLDLMCAGSRKLTPHYTKSDLVQFSTFYNFGVFRDNTPLNFYGTVLLDGKELGDSAISVVGYPDTDTICFNVAHSGKILTIMKDSVIYYEGIAVKVEETFNARWNGSSWIYVDNVPAPPAPEYITLQDGSVKTVENKVILTPGYTANGVVQFINVNDFGVSADDTPLSFEGVVLLDGQRLYRPNFVGYPNNLTIALKAPHQGKLLTIMQGSVIYYGDKAVVVSQTFNQKWNGSSWESVAQIPEEPAMQHITLADGTTRALVGVVELNALFTLDHLIQFPDVYDFGAAEDSTPLGFQGTLLLQGKQVDKPVFTCHKNSTTIAVEKLNHKGKVVTIMEGTIFYNDSVAVKVGKTFNAVWDGTSWSAVDTIPEPPAKEYVDVNGQQIELIDTVTLTPGYTLDSLIQFVNVYDFGAAEDSTPLGFQGTLLLQGKRVDKPVFTCHKNSTTIAVEKLNHKGKVVTIMEGAIFYNDSVAVKVGKTFNAVWDGTSWSAVDAIPEPPAKEYVDVNGQQIELVDTVTLTPGYTLDSLIQFVNVYDFGAAEDSTPLGFQGTLLLQGKQVDKPAFTCHKNSTTIAVEKLNHKGKVVTIMEGAIFYNASVAVKVGKTFNAVWDGTSWSAVDAIPEPPAKEYVDVNGQQIELIDTVTLTPGYTLDTLIQFVNVYDFGAAEDSTPLGFQGTLLLQGKQVDKPVFTCHKNSTTIAVEKLNHKGKVVTIMEGAIFYNDSVAVKVGKTFNAVWDGTSWSAVDTIPEPPAKEYVDVNGQQIELIDTVTLTPGYTLDSLVQFLNVYDFGVPADDTPLGFAGEIYLNGVKQAEGTVRFDGYANNTTITLKMIAAQSLTDQVLTIQSGAIIYYGDVAVKVGQEFSMRWDGSQWTAAQMPEPSDPEDPTEPAKTDLNFEYRFGTDRLIQLNTDLPATTPCVNFLTTDNGCSIDESKNQYQHIGWIGMEKASDTIVLTLQFNNAFAAGQTYFLPAGAVFGFTDGKTYTLDLDYTFTFNGSSWTMETAEPSEPEQPTEPEVPTEPSEPDDAVLNLQYRFGNNKLIQLNTDLPATTPCVNFLTTDNGCSIDESKNQYQHIGWIGMEKASDTIVLTLQFNNAFAAGQTYFLPAGAVFGFTDGNTYTLDMDYTFTFNGSSWTMETAEPSEPEQPTEPEVPTEPSEPDDAVLNLQYRFGNNKLIQLNTDLPATTPCVNFLTTDNGCSIDESKNQYQHIGWIGMEKVSNTVVLTLQFNNAFTAGQTYFLPAGAVFGFTDGNTYTLDMDYTFTFNGSSWTVQATEPEETKDSLLSLLLRFGTANLIQMNTNLPSDTPCSNFLTGDNGCQIDESANQYQQAGWIGMERVEDTIVLTFHFNKNFASGQNYFLPKGALFGFLNGSKYALDKDYTFIYDGSSWSMA